MKQYRAELVRSRIESGMTVAELIEELQSQNPEARVVFACDYGDHCHTEQALPIRSAEQLDIDSFCLTESGYSNSDVAISEFSENEETGDIEKPDGVVDFEVVVLRMERR